MVLCVIIETVLLIGIILVKLVSLVINFIRNRNSNSNKAEGDQQQQKNGNIRSSSLYVEVWSRKNEKQENKGNPKNKKKYFFSI